MRSSRQLSLLAVAFGPALDPFCDVLSNAFSLHRAHDLEAATNSIKQLQIDVVLLSPSMTRFEQSALCRRVHEKCGFPVVALYTFLVDAEIQADLSLSAFCAPERISVAINTYLKERNTGWTQDKVAA